MKYNPRTGLPDQDIPDQAAAACSCVAREWLAQGCDVIYVLGTVSLWGDVIEHEHGYRAERAEICSLDYSPLLIRQDDHSKLAVFNRKRVSEEWRHSYLFDFEKLKEFYGK